MKESESDEMKVGEWVKEGRKEKNEGKEWRKVNEDGICCYIRHSTASAIFIHFHFIDFPSSNLSFIHHFIHFRSFFIVFSVIHNVHVLCFLFNVFTVLHKSMLKVMVKMKMKKKKKKMKICLYTSTWSTPDSLNVTHSALSEKHR